MAAPYVLQSEAMAMYGDVFTLITSNVNAGRETIEEYSRHWNAEEGSPGARASRAQILTNHYYDLVTDFYEYGWGQSFHFAPRFKGEAFDASLARHEHWLAAKLNLKPGMKALDVGCGVGGPMRTIARFSDSQVVGLNNNQYQIQRGERAVNQESLGHLCSFVHGDFMNMSFADETFDAAYAIEATCHAPNRVGVFSEMYRVMKPGGTLGLYEWVMTNEYNNQSSEQQAIKLGIEHGDSIAELPHWSVVVDAIKEVGFEVVEHFDIAERAAKTQGPFNVPWYRPLEGHFTLTGFKHTPIGRMCTAYMVRSLEFFGLAPKGSYATAMMLEDGAKNLMLGGQKEIITPMYWVLAKKPVDANSKA
uniref:Methyltransferase n=1 Tax=Eutreptiella gymnastica TaxID=73025 RepID=A0A7S1HUX8_9EUGL